MDERDLGTALEEQSGDRPGDDDAGSRSVPGQASPIPGQMSGQMPDPKSGPTPGEEPAQPGEVTAGPGADGDAHGADGPTTEGVLDALNQVFDPELGINIVDLGLVYDVTVSEDGDVDIQYTLTTMGCPIGPMIEDQMRAFLAPVPGVNEVRPEMVLRPPWTPEMMSDEAKAALGVF